jgi:hypothetical protein
MLVVVAVGGVDFEGCMVDDDAKWKRDLYLY